MSNNTIDARLLRQMFLAGAKNLELNKEWINDLNVFPVPDGDTGTNMTLTILSAVKEVQRLSDVTMGTLAKAISSGSLRGARGNSGVILSQLLRGFTKEIKAVEEIDTTILANAMDCARAIDQGLKTYGVDLGPILYVENARVGAGDFVGDLTGCQVVCILVGERPGLVTAESMSAYITYGPHTGIPESKRTVVSNIHRQGTPAVEAGAHIAQLLMKILEAKASGVDLLRGEVS